MTRHNIIAMTIIGISLWFVGALFIKYIPLFAAPDIKLAALYAVTIPLVWVSIRMIAIIAKLSPEYLCAGIAIGNAAAIITDGVAMAWVPGLYSMVGDYTPLGAAWLLWTAGWFCLLSVVLSRQSAH